MLANKLQVLEQGAKTKPDQRQHHRKTDTDAEQVWHSPTYAEVQAGGGQHHVIGPGRHRRNDDKYDQRDKEFEFDCRLRFNRF